LWAGFVFVLVLAGGAVYCAMRPRLRVIGFGLIWFIIALLPTSLLPMPMAEVMNDHRTFFPYAGLAMALAGALQLLLAPARKWSPAAAIAGCCAGLACYGGASAATYLRNRDWRDEESLWRDVTIKSPMNGRGLMNYGNTRMARGDYVSALDYFHRAQALLPYYPTLYINIAVAESGTGHPAEAERDFQRALAMAPGGPDSYTFYARWLIQQGRGAEAIALLQKALAISPGDLSAQSFLATAMNEASTAESADSWLNLSLRLYQQRDFPGAIAAAEKALKIRPDYAEAWNNMGAAYNSMAQYATATAVLEKAVRLKPDMALARNNLDFARRMLKGDAN
jgi:tetratricopeptide (TPR) repeat protein